MDTVDSARRGRNGSYAVMPRFFPIGKEAKGAAGFLLAALPALGALLTALAISGDLITVWINGVKVTQATDGTFRGGAPGMGFFLQGASGVNRDYGFSRKEFLGRFRRARVVFDQEKRDEEETARGRAKWMAAREHGGNGMKEATT